MVFTHNICTVYTTHFTSLVAHKHFDIFYGYATTYIIYNNIQTRF